MRKPWLVWVLLGAVITAGSAATWGALRLLRNGVMVAAAVEEPETSTLGSSEPGSSVTGSSTPGSATPGSSTPGSSTPDPSIPDSSKPDSPKPGSSTPGPSTPEPSGPPPGPPVDPGPATGIALPADWAKAPELLAGLTEAMNGFSGTWSVAVEDLTNGNRWSLRGAQLYHPASTIKMPVTLFAMSERKAGRLSWNDVIQYTQADFESPGGGAFETSPFGGWYPVENLVNRALIYSNNVAVNMLGRHLGWQNVRNFTKTIDGELYRQPDGMPLTTALGELGWWRYLYQVSLDDPQSAELILGPLSQVAYEGRIAAGLPGGVRFVHKFGSYDTNEHDGGIVWSEGGPYAMVIMTHGAPHDEADTYIPLAAAAIHRVMGL